MRTNYSLLISLLSHFAVQRRNRSFARAALAQLHGFGLTQCDFSDESCDCRDIAVVHDVANERETCLRHFGRGI